MIDTLITTLSKELELSAEEIADTIWLALQIQESQSESTATQNSKNDLSQPSSKNEQLEGETLPETPTQTSDSRESASKQSPDEQKAGIYPRNQHQTLFKSELSFKVPDAPSLREPLTLARALKPLMRRIPSGTTLVLDEAATTQQIANEGLWLPVLRPTLEPWLDLELVVDEGISMQIWRHTIRELERLLKNYGIFRDVRVWGLIADNLEQVQIRRGIGATAKNQSPRSPAELIDPSGRRLVLVVSDCVSSLWRDGKVTTTLEIWAKQGSMAIVQMLPKWLWKRTALGRVSEVRLQGLNPGDFNQKLIAKEVSLWDELEGMRGVKVPVFTLEPDKVATWAQMLSGKGGIWTSGYVFKLDSIPVNKGRDLFNLNYGQQNAEQRVQAFRVTASPMARKLAGLLAAAPAISLPIVRLIQRTLLKESQQVHVAEVFLGGLLRPLSEINAETNPDYVQYEFMDGVRELLVDSVPSGYVLNVVDEVSKDVAKNLGLSLEDFAAVLRNPQQVRGSEIAGDVGYFATVTAQVLRRLGGEYVKIAEELELHNFEYMQAKVDEQVTLNEAKLIMVGEARVGKSCLLAALREDEWLEGRPTTHGIETKAVIVTDTDSGTKIALNCWDFGGQPVYRPTHQLFFSAPAVYLVVWKPGEGSEQGFVKKWITLIKHREPDAKVLVVATHGGPGQQQPDIDRQEIRDRFGSDTVLGFFHVNSKPDPQNSRNGVAELKKAIASVAASLPEMGRSVPAKWQRVREILQTNDRAYLPYDRVIAICTQHEIDKEQAELFLRFSHSLGDIIHYHYDPILRDIVILKPDWLAKAISFVLDDELTRRRNGLVDFEHLSELWSNPPFPGENGYPKELHPIFLKLMERFDLSYRVVLDPAGPSNTSLIPQLVPDTRPELPNWGEEPETGDRQQVQICRIVDDRGQLAVAEGLFYQLIVRLHKYSLERRNYEKSIHWQRGLMLDDDYNGRALLEYIDTDVKITVRAAYPERFLSYLTAEIKWLVENYWEGLRCNVMVPCIMPCGKNLPGNALFEVEKLIESKKKNRHEYPCPISGCGEWQNIDCLLNNASTTQPPSQEIGIQQFRNMFKDELKNIREDLVTFDKNIREDLVTFYSRNQERYQSLSQEQRIILSKVDEEFASLMQMLTDEAKDGPRLFSFKLLIDPKFFDRPKWMKNKFKITLWCEHSRLPLPALNPHDKLKGVYELEVSREWFTKAAPYLKILTGTLSLVLPVAGSAAKFMLDDATYKGIEEELDLGQKSIESTLKESDLATNLSTDKDAPDWQQDEAAIRAKGSILRELHALLKAKDRGFGGLVRVRNRRREFVWVHEQFVDEY